MFKMANQWPCYPDFIILLVLLWEITTGKLFILFSAVKAKSTNIKMSTIIITMFFLYFLIT